MAEILTLHPGSKKESLSWISVDLKRFIEQGVQLLDIFELPGEEIKLHRSSHPDIYADLIEYVEKDSACKVLTEEILNHLEGRFANVWFKEKKAFLGFITKEIITKLLSHSRSLQGLPTSHLENRLLAEIDQWSQLLKPKRKLNPSDWFILKFVKDINDFANENHESLERQIDEFAITHGSSTNADVASEWLIKNIDIAEQLRIEANQQNELKHRAFLKLRKRIKSQIVAQKMKLFYQYGFNALIWPTIVKTYSNGISASSEKDNLTISETDLEKIENQFFVECVGYALYQCKDTYTADYIARHFRELAKSRPKNYLGEHNKKKKLVNLIYQDKSVIEGAEDSDSGFNVDYWLDSEELLEDTLFDTDIESTVLGEDALEGYQIEESDSFREELHIDSSQEQLQIEKLKNELFEEGVRKLKEVISEVSIKGFDKATKKEVASAAVLKAKRVREKGKSAVKLIPYDDEITRFSFGKVKRILQANPSSFVFQKHQIPAKSRIKSLFDRPTEEQKTVFGDSISEISARLKRYYLGIVKPKILYGALYFPSCYLRYNLDKNDPHNVPAAGEGSSTSQPLSDGFIRLTKRLRKPQALSDLEKKYVLAKTRIKSKTGKFKYERLSNKEFKELIHRFFNEVEKSFVKLFGEQKLAELDAALVSKVKRQENEKLRISKLSNVIAWIADHDNPEQVTKDMQSGDREEKTDLDQVQKLISNPDNQSILENVKIKRKLFGDSQLMLLEELFSQLVKETEDKPKKDCQGLREVFLKLYKDLDD